MKIIMSPSKTKKIEKIKNIKENIFLNKIEMIIEAIRKIPLDKMEKIFKLKGEKLEYLKKFYENYSDEIGGNTIKSYTGIAFKSLEVDGFSEEDLDFAEEHLVILSALYGILTPLSNIKEYRLDMVNSIFENISLYEFWKKEIDSYFESEDIIINLASKEYSKMISSKNIYEFEFYDEIDGKLKQISTNSKKMRGFTTNYIIKNKILNVDKLKNINLNGYEYDEKMSNDKKYVYVKSSDNLEKRKKR